MIAASRGGRARSPSAEETRRLELALRLSESTDLRRMLASAHDHLARYVAADYAALGLSSAEDPGVYEWHVAQLPETFFQAYPQLVEHDFVRLAALRHPNVVLSDEQMIAPAQLHRNPLYVRARELGVKLERVLAVMLDARAPWHGGFVLYRAGRTPFSAREQRELQAAVPLLIGGVRSAHLLQRAEARAGAYESLARMSGMEALVVDSRGRELFRTPGLEALLLRHFSLLEEWVGPLPGLLARLLSDLLRPERPPRLSAQIARGSLRVDLARLPHGSWAALFEDLMPARWRTLLTAREVEMVSGVLQGWDNELIASELKCARETVKKHLQAAYAKLAIPSRAKLIALAREER